MITQSQFIAHFESLYKQGAIYVWGGNCETITKESMDRLYDMYGSVTYNRVYYDKKLEEGVGKPGADCSGAIYPLSRNDVGASSYYRDQCSERGPIRQIPEDLACLVFTPEFTHVGAYLGNGMVIEMANSVRNCVKSKLDLSRWEYYGIPEWLENPMRAMNHTIDSAVVTNVQKWINKYMPEHPVKITGEFNLSTKRALCCCLQKCLKEDFGCSDLKVDGIFGPKTKAACVSARQSQDLTYICQAMLCLHGMYIIHSLKDRDFDGIYGPGTEKSVMEYQQKTRGLRQDGDCGQATFYALFNK